MPTDANLLHALFTQAVAAAQPGRALGFNLPSPPRGKTRVLGFGKAAATMGEALESAWPNDAPLEGVLVGPEGAPTQGLRRLRYLAGSHPLPSEGSQAGALALLEAAQGLGADDLVIALVSGGASSLACAPVDGMSLADKQQLNQALLASGAPIHEMNVVRKHVSRIKGGRLAVACGLARVLTLVVSDVPGDALDIVGSGPTLPDPSTCSDAIAVLDRYGIAVPAAVRAGLESGALETPKPGDPCFARHESRLIASPQAALLAAAREAERLGWRAHVLSDALEGEARAVGGVLAQLALAVGREGSPFQAPCLLLSGGETTVTLRHAQPGQGGRNAETLLGCVLALQGQPGAERISALMADTDGIDGAGPGAGAWWLGSDAAPMAELRAALDAHDAGAFFAQRGRALVTGATGTNVNDFRVLRIEAAD